MNYLAVILLLLPLMQGGESSNPPEGSECQSEGGFPLHWLQNVGQCCRCHNGVVRCKDALPCPPLPGDTKDCDIIDVCGCNWLICDGSETGVGESEEEGNEEESNDGEDDGTEMRRKRDVPERDTKINHRNARKGKNGQSKGEGKGASDTGVGSEGELNEMSKANEGPSIHKNRARINPTNTHKITYRNGIKDQNKRKGKGKNPKGGKGKTGKNNGKGKGASVNGVGSKGKLTDSTTGSDSTTGTTVSGATASTTYDQDNDGDYNSNETGDDSLNDGSDSNEMSKVNGRPSIHKNRARINPTNTHKITYRNGKGKGPSDTGVGSEGELNKMSQVNAGPSIQKNRARINPTNTHKITYHNGIKEANKRKGKGKGGSSKGGKGKSKYKGGKGKGGKQGKAKHGNKGKGKGGFSGSNANKEPKGKGSKGAKIDALSQPTTTVDYYNYNDTYAYPTGSNSDSYNYNDQNSYETYTDYGNNGGGEHSNHDNHDNHDTLYHHANENYDDSYENHLQDNAYDHQENSTLNSTEPVVEAHYHDHELDMENLK